jgi:Na+/H+-translocating membrane pyrophosphatase
VFESGAVTGMLVAGLALLAIAVYYYFLLKFNVDEVIYFFGSGIRYTLTSVVGQVIGLVWRGIIEGLKK